jgi:hypothetical protein
LFSYDYEKLSALIILEIFEEKEPEHYGSSKIIVSIKPTKLRFNHESKGDVLRVIKEYLMGLQKVYQDELTRTLDYEDSLRKSIGDIGSKFESV